MVSGNPFSIFPDVTLHHSGVSPCSFHMNDNVLYPSRTAADRRVLGPDIAGESEGFPRPGHTGKLINFVWLRFRLSGPFPSLPAGINTDDSDPWAGIVACYKVPLSGPVGTPVSGGSLSSPLIFIIVIMEAE